MNCNSRRAIAYQETTKDDKVTAESRLHNNTILKGGIDRGRATVVMRVALVLGEDDAVALDGRLVGRTSGRGRALVVGSSSGALFLVLRGNGTVAGVALRVTLEKVELCHRCLLCSEMGIIQRGCGSG